MADDPMDDVLSLVEKAEMYAGSAEAAYDDFDPQLCDRFALLSITNSLAAMASMGWAQWVNAEDPL